MLNRSFPLRRSKASVKKRAAEEFFSFHMKEKNSFLESSDSDIKKQVTNAVPESTRSQQNMVSTSLKAKS